MKNLIYILLVLGTMINAQKSTFQYVSPKPASIMVSNETNIIFRHSEGINRATLSNNLIRVEGSKSGVHTGELILSDDDKTIVFNPVNVFSNNEEVNVLLQEGIKTVVGLKILEFSFSFNTAPAEIKQLHDVTFDENFPSLENQTLTKLRGNEATSSLPAPPITIDSINNPSSGYIFMATWDRNVPHLYGNFIFVLDSSGNIVDSVRVNGAPYDFQVQPNGLLSYALGDFALHVPLPGEELQHMVLDQNLAVVDSFKMKNGYSTDFHEFLMLPNGHVMMMSYHTITYDMS
ncbi:MAG: Ig-like domain-containing protein, partial [Ignavibacteriae bacterium]|nr:Ig-like domain-containing protein [Ignavibacteriota bacterium]